MKLRKAEGELVSESLYGNWRKVSIAIFNHKYDSRLVVTNQ